MALPLRSVIAVCDFMGLGTRKGKCRAKTKKGKCCTRKTDGKSLFCWQHQLKGQWRTHSEWFCVFMELIGGGARVKQVKPLLPIRVKGQRNDRRGNWVFQVRVPEGPGYRKMWRKQGYIEFIECWKETKEEPYLSPLGRTLSSFATTSFERSARWTLPDNTMRIRGELEWYAQPRGNCLDQGYLTSRLGWTVLGRLPRAVWGPITKTKTSQK